MGSRTLLPPPTHPHPDDSTSDQVLPEGLHDEPRDLGPGVRSLGLNTCHAPLWTPKDAFRELYQNWKDAIVDSFDLHPRSFKLDIEETPNEIKIFQGRSPEDNFGIICFDKKMGSLQLTNFNAQLLPRHLKWGVTTKRDPDRCIGEHGEGLKLAALVLCRNGHKVRYLSNSRCWDFSFRGEELFCSGKKDSFRTMCRYGGYKGLGANTWGKVAVRISKPKESSGRAISEAEFRSWLEVALEVALEINGPRSVDIIETDYGDLILDKRFRGRIYLKGLLVPNDSPDGKQYAFGYNFVRGRVDHDRKRLTDQAEEAQMLAMIWEQSIKERGGDVTKEYLKLLLNSPGCADVSMADEKITKLTAKALWEFLRTTARDGFFYPVGESSQEDIIRSVLKKRPVEVPLLVWSILRKYSLARSPQEERIYLSENPQTTEIKDDDFHVSVKRALKATLLLDRRLEDIKIQFIKRRGLTIIVHFDERKRMLQIHGLERKCDRLAEECVKLVLDKLQLPLPSCVQLREEACERIQQTPQSIKVFRISRSNELEVSWSTKEGKIAFKTLSTSPQYYVILHRMRTCWSRKDDLLHKSSPGISPGVSDCGCTYLLVTGVRSAVFKGLSQEEEYFPMVARQENNSFFGLPPNSVTLNNAPSHAPYPKSQPRPNSPGGINNPISLPEDSEDSEDSEIHQEAVREGQDDLNDTNIPLRRPTPSGQTQHGLLNTRIVEPAAWHEDDEAWRVWHEQELPRIFTQLSSRGALESEGIKYTVISKFLCQRLGYTFEKDEYTLICMYPESYSAQYVILVHYILEVGDSYYLGVTKYSALDSTLGFGTQYSPTAHGSAISGRELLLHFRRFDFMGGIDDVEIIQVRDISSASNISSYDGIDHVLKPPQDIAKSGYFCRFAVGSDENTVCLTPISSKLLQYKDRWRRVNFTIPPKPLVFDHTPNVLGPSEGFSRAGFCIHSAIGFDPDRHLTWKMRHSTSEVYDGAPCSVLAELEAGRLGRIYPPSPSTASVALVAGENTCFRLSDGNTRMPSKQQFLKPLDILDAAATAHLKPAFLVLLTPPGVLHPSAIGRFSESILKLLEQRLSVHMKLTPLQDHGVPQNRSSLILVASPICGLVRFEPKGPLPSAKVGDIIRELAFVNPRASQSDDRSGFACTTPNSSNMNGQYMPKKTIYNHHTGLPAPSHTKPINPDATVVSVSPNSIEALVHPDRKDRLTVRELARLQGFDDDFVFYHSLSSQYTDVANAIPPVVAQHAANAILHLIHSIRIVTQDELREGQPARKRARLEGADVEVNGVGPR